MSEIKIIQTKILEILKRSGYISSKIKKVLY